MKFLVSIIISNGIFKKDSLVLDSSWKLSKATHRFEALEGLRAIACFLVLIAHFNINPFNINPKWESIFFNSIRRILPGELGVIIFFCLSSFLIILFLLEEYEKTKKIDILKFIIRRSLRIWPLYFFIIFFTLYYSHFVLPKEEWVVFESYYRYLIFIANWFKLTADFDVFWTICVEEQFYIAIPFFITFAFKSNKRKIIAVITCLLIGNIWRLFYIRYSSHFNTPLYYLTPTYIDCFTYGGLTAWLYKNKINIFHCMKVKSSLFAWIIIFCLMLICGLGHRLIWWAPYSYITILSYTLIPIAVCLLISHCSMNQGKNLAYFLSLPLMRSLGVLSFGVYLWHVFGIIYIITFQVNVMHFNKVIPGEFFYLLLFIEYCLICVLLASLSFQLVEWPFLELRSYIYSENSLMHQNRWQLPIKGIIIFCTLGIVCILGFFRCVQLI